MLKVKILYFLLIINFLFSQQNFTFPKIKSSISMPVKIPLSEISKMANASVKDLIFQDDSYTDNNNDQFKVKVWKTRPIRIIGGTRDNLLIEVPLKIWAEKGIGTLGVYSYQNTTFETVMYFSTQIAFNPNWTVSTKTSSAGYKWVTKPVLDYGTVKIPITSFVEKSLSEQQASFCKTMDDQMKTELNFQKYAILAWNQFSQPINVSEEYNTWLKITPQNVNVTPLKIYKDELDTTIGIDVFSETFTGLKPEASSPSSKVPNFNLNPLLKDKFLLQTTANIPFTEATKIAEKTFLGKEYNFRDGKEKIKITGIKVYNQEGKIMIEAQTEGSVTGTSYISGTPVYNAQKRKIVLTDTKFKLKTNNFLQKTLTLLFQGKIVKMIEEEYGIPTQELEDSSKKSIEEAFNKEYYKGLKMSGKVYRLQPSTVLVNDIGITTIIDTEASLILLVKGM